MPSCSVRERIRTSSSRSGTRTADNRGTGNRKKTLRRRAIAGLVVALVILGVLFGLSDAGELWHRARVLSPAWTAAAAVVALLTFVFMAATHRSLLAALGHRVPMPFVIRASFLHLAISRIVRSGGASGLALIAWMLRRRGVPVSSSAAMKLGEFFVTNIVFAVLFLGGALFLSWPARTDDEASSSIPSILLILCAAGVFLVLALLWRVVVLDRRRIVWTDRLVRVAGATGRLLKRDDWDEQSRRSIDRVLRTGRDLLSRPSRLARAQGWAILRIGGSVGALWACVEAARVEVDAATIVLAWCLSKIAAVTIVVPAGLGVIEASLTGVLAGRGVAYEAALVIALVNRVTYHLVPTALALAMSRPLFEKRREESGQVLAE